MRLALQLTANLLLFAIGVGVAAGIYPNPYKDPILITGSTVCAIVCIAAWLRAVRLGSTTARTTVILATVMLSLAAMLAMAASFTSDILVGYSLAAIVGCLCYQLNLAFNPKTFGLKQVAVVALWSCCFAATIAGLNRLVLAPIIHEERIVSHHMHYTVENYHAEGSSDDRPAPPGGWKQIRFWMDSAPNQAVIVVSSDLASHLQTLSGPTVRVDLKVQYVFREIYSYSVHGIEGYQLLQHNHSVLSWNVQERLYDGVEHPRGTWREQRNSTISLLDRRYAKN